MASTDPAVSDLIHFDSMGTTMKIIEMFLKVTVLVFLVFEECLDQLFQICII